MKRLMIIAVAVLMLLSVSLVAAACGVNDDNVGTDGTVSTTEDTTETTVTPDETTTTVPAETTTTTTASDVTSFNVYFARGEKISAHVRSVPKTSEVGATAMKALIEGPTATEEDAGVTSEIPNGTAFLDLTINDGIATVNLSKEYASGGGSLSMAMRLAQVVFTLTQFPTIQTVTFALDGEPVEVFGGEGIVLDSPVDRSDYEDLSPAILVESPTLGQDVGTPLRVRGTANVFEATFLLKVSDTGGRLIADEVITATSGTGTRGTFDVTVPVIISEAGRGELVVFSESPRDGSRINVVEIAIQLKP